MSSTKDLQTIDPTALAQVSGGAARTASGGEGDTAVMTALGGILDSLTSLARGNQQSGFSAQEMMLFMMLVQQRTGPQVVAAAPPPTNWTWDQSGGYWIVK